MTTDRGRIVRLGVLDRYGVQWAPLPIARDVLQNFFDAAPDLRDVTVRVTRDEGGGDPPNGEPRGAVRVEGPSVFDVELLAYVGATTKLDGRSAGGFGEGFKVAALVLARDHGVRVSAGAGAWRLEVFFDDVSLGRELCYRVFAVDPPHAGSWVQLDGCPAPILTAFEGARALFRHPGNPHFNDPVALSADGACGVFRLARGQRPTIYYRRQFRGTFRAYGTPFALVCDTPVDALEGDRDRTDLDPAPVAAAIARALDPAALYDALRFFEGSWEYGDTVLYALLRVAVERKLQWSFPEGWLARAANGQGAEAMAKRQGFTLAVPMFRDVGMRAAVDYYRGGLVTRAPDAEQRARIDVMVDLYASLLGRPRPAMAFEVFDDPRAAVLGQHLGGKVIVATKVLSPRTFSNAAGTVLHELAHETGAEESEPFKRRLAALCRAALAKPEALAHARRAWRRVRPVVPVAPEVSPSPAEAPDTAAPVAPPPPDPLAEALGLTTRYAQYAASLDFESGVPVTCVLPACTPLHAMLFEHVLAAGQRAGVKVAPYFRAVTPATQNLDRVPGLPSFWAGSQRVDLGTSAGHGWCARHYGDEGKPDLDALADAIRAAFERRDRTLPTLGLHAPASAESAVSEAREKLSRRTVGAEFTLYSLWNGALHRAARAALAHAAAADPKGSAKALADAAWAHVDRAIVASRALRAGDASFEPADTLDEHMMAVAQGAAVLARVQSAEGDDVAARAAFDAVRALLAKAWELPVCAVAREAALFVALAGTPLGENMHTRAVPATAVDLDVLAARWEAACVKARAWQAVADEDGRLPYEARAAMMHTYWDERPPPPDARKEAREKAQAKRLDDVWTAALDAGGPVAALDALMAVHARRKGRRA